MEEKDSIDVEAATTKVLSRNARAERSSVRTIYFPLPMKKSERENMARSGFKFDKETSERVYFKI